MDVKMQAEELSAFLDEVFPQVRGRFAIEDVRPMACRVRMAVGEADLRPGGTVSGPAMFTLADCAFYAATLAMIGREALTVTTSLTINFMRKPEPRDLWAEARILKLGRTLSVGDVFVHSDGVEGPVAHASVTYAIPPRKA
ncbi:MAG: PaaI family thioesterase [Pseudomonadota bacterium]